MSNMMITEKVQGRVICPKCGKDIEYTKAVELFQNCPRCGAPLGRDMNKETAEVKKVIKYDFIRRTKKYFLPLGLFITALCVAYNIVGFFTQLFVRHWWLALITLPFVSVSILITNYSRLASTSKKWRIIAWLVVMLNVAAIALIIVTCIPDVNAKLGHLYTV